MADFLFFFTLKISEKNMQLISTLRAKLQVLRDVVLSNLRWTAKPNILWNQAGLGAADDESSLALPLLAVGIRVAYLAHKPQLTRPLDLSGFGPSQFPSAGSLCTHTLHLVNTSFRQVARASCHIPSAMGHLCCTSAQPIPSGSLPIELLFKLGFPTLLYELFTRDSSLQTQRTEIMNKQSNKQPQFLLDLIANRRGKTLFLKTNLFKPFQLTARLLLLFTSKTAKYNWGCSFLTKFWYPYSNHRKSHLSYQCSLWVQKGKGQKMWRKHFPSLFGCFCMPDDRQGRIQTWHPLLASGSRDDSTRWILLPHSALKHRAGHRKSRERHAGDWRGSEEDDAWEHLEAVNLNQHEFLLPV